MEIHHSPHIPKHSKPWKEYLLEGLMIFIAVSLGYAAENMREHYVETKKAIISAHNLYVDVKADSINYASSMLYRHKQDSCYKIIKEIYTNNRMSQEVPTIYAAHSCISTRYAPIMNSLALDEVKNSGTLKYLDDDKLKAAIQGYASLGNDLKLREQREFNYIDRMIDPITTSHFNFDFYSPLGNSLRINNNKIVFDIPIPANLKIMKEEKLDWDNYFSIMGMLQMIRESTEEVYIVPTQKKNSELLALLRNYLIEHDAFKE